MPRICSRCGREQRRDEAVELGELLSTLASEPDPARGVFADAAPWAQIGGADVCPRCLTTEEQQSLAGDYIELVEAEVARVRKAGTDPAPYEAALIAYAMVLRSRISGARPGRELEVAITGAFLTGQPLDARISEYSRFQRALGDALRDLPDQGWDYVRWRGMPTYASGGGFASMVPLVLVHRDDGEFLARAKHVFNERHESERHWLDELMRGWGWRLRSMRVEVYDLGMAVITGTYGLRLPIGVPLDMVPNVIDAVVRLKPDPETQIRSPVATTFQTLAEETVSQFTRAVDDHASAARQEPWLTPFLEALSRGEATEARVERPGRLLWLHPVYVVASTGASGSAANHSAITEQFATPFGQETALPGGTFFPGIGASLVVADPTTGAADMALRLSKLQWAYFAHYMEIDRGLLATLDANRWHNRRRLEALELDAECTFDKYLRVVEARARLDSYLTSLGGDELAVWKVISDVQKLDALVDAVDRKIDVLRTVAERRVQQAAADRARKTGRVLGALTSLTVITVAVAVLAYLVGGRSDEAGHLTLRWIIIGGAALLSVAIYLLAHGEWSRLRRKAKGHGER